MEAVGKLHGSAQIEFVDPEDDDEVKSTVAVLNECVTEVRVAYTGPPPRPGTIIAGAIPELIAVSLLFTMLTAYRFLGALTEEAAKDTYRALKTRLFGLARRGKREWGGHKFAPLAMVVHFGDFDSTVYLYFTGRESEQEFEMALTQARVTLDWLSHYLSQRLPQLTYHNIFAFRFEPEGAEWVDIQPQSHI